MTDRAKLTPDAIEAVADSLHAAGKRVSVATVRAALGRGSNSTITPVLAAWRERIEAVESVTIPESLKTELDRLGAQLWRVASAEHNEQIEALKRAHAQQIEALREDLSAVENFGQALEAQVAEYARAAKAHAATEKKLERENVTLRAELASSKTALIEADARYTLLLDKLTQLSSALNAGDS